MTKYYNLSKHKTDAVFRVSKNFMNIETKLLKQAKFFFFFNTLKWTQGVQVIIFYTDI